MTTNNIFNPLEWAKQENAPQKSTVKNQTPAATHGDWAQTDDYAKAREVVERIVLAGIDLTDDYNDWFRIGSALAYGLGESGRELYHEVSCMSSKYNVAECDKKYDNCLRTGNGSITLGTFFQMAKDAGINISATRHTNVADIAMSHQQTENREKHNSLIINDYENLKDSGSRCECAKIANDEEDICSQSYFSSKINDTAWCPFLRAVADTMDTPEGKDKMLLATLNMLSGVIPNYYGLYSGKVVYPPLYIIYYGPAGSLKGEIADATHLLTPLKKELQGVYAKEMDTYEQEHALWDAKGGRKERSERGPEPKKPDFRTPLIPGDSSASKVIKHMKANGSMGGTLFESEARVISNTLSSDFGKQWSTILLKTAHHETISLTRVEDDRFIEIEEPRMAVGLTCTPGLLPKFFPSFEDGLGSRFLFWRLNRKFGWRNPFLDNQQPLSETYKELGKEFLELYHEMDKLGERRIQFLLTKEQQNFFNEYFSPLTEEVTELLGDGSESFIYRLGTQGFRIAMLLTLFRRFCSWDRTHPLFEPEEQAIQCEEIDFSIMITMVDTLVNHTIKIYASLAKEDDSNPFIHHVNLNDGEKRLYRALPTEFNSEIIEQTLAQLGIKPETAKRYLSDFVKKHHVAERLAKGHYRKINIKK